MDTTKRMEALEIAMTNEKRERDFYLKHSERTKNPLGQKMFKRLSEEENEHMERITVLHKRLKEQGRWPEEETLSVSSSLVNNVLGSVVKAVERLPETDMDDIGAVREAIEFETKGETFYAELAEGTDNPKEKEFLLFLSSMEHDHLMSLKETLEYFENPEGWFTAKERHGLDGA